MRLPRSGKTADSKGCWKKRAALAVKPQKWKRQHC